MERNDGLNEPREDPGTAAGRPVETGAGGGRKKRPEEDGGIDSARVGGDDSGRRHDSRGDDRSGTAEEWDPFSDEWADLGQRENERGSAGAVVPVPRDPDPESRPADVPPFDPGTAGARGQGTTLASREFDVSSAESVADAIAFLLEHRARGRGKIVGLAGLPRHGKSKFADRLREKAARRQGADLRYDKTVKGAVKMYYIPGRTEHHVLVDMAGEDFQSLGDYDAELPGLVREFLWPILQRMDGLILMMALPIVWARWNESGREARARPRPAAVQAMRAEARRMVNAHITLLKYALVAGRLEKLRARHPHLGLQPDAAPTRNQVDDAFRAAGRLRAPVAVGFSKADLYEGHGARRGLHTPDLPGWEVAAPPIHPRRTDPTLLGWLHFPELFEFLTSHTRHFRFDFVQVLDDPGDDPFESTASDASIDHMIGAESLLEFVTAHPWTFPGMSTSVALRLDRLLRRSHWREDAVRTLGGR